MLKRVLSASIILTLPMVGLAESELDSYRCGNKLIKLGMTAQDIFNTCGASGEPSRTFTKEEQKANPYARYSDGTMPVHTDHYDYWLYEPYGKFDTYVVFRNGRVIRIYSTNDRN